MTDAWPLFKEIPNLWYTLRDMVTSTIHSYLQTNAAMRMCVFTNHGEYLVFPGKGADESIKAPEGVKPRGRR
jgi:hypothetical protein